MRSTSLRLLFALTLTAGFVLDVVGRSNNNNNNGQQQQLKNGGRGVNNDNGHGVLTTVSPDAADWSAGSGTSVHHYGHKQQRPYASGTFQQRNGGGNRNRNSDSALKTSSATSGSIYSPADATDALLATSGVAGGGEEQSQVDASVVSEEAGAAAGSDWSTTAVSSAVGGGGSANVTGAAGQQPGQQQQQRGRGGRRGQDRDGNCSSRCKMFEETISLTKEAIKQEILNKLGLKRPPNITGRALPRIPPLDHLLDIYGMQSDEPLPTLFKPGPVFEEAEDDYHAKTEKVISFAQEPPKAWSVPANMEVQYFKFSHSVMANKVLWAKLWVHLRESRVVQDCSTLVHVYKVARSSEQKASSPLLEHVVSAKVDFKPRRGGWVTVDIKKLVADWFRHPHNNLGVVVQAFDKEGRQLVATDRKAENDIPFIEVYGTDESKKRTKRMIGLNCEDNSNEVRCCRYPLIVDFEEFGWDWIIAPKKYEANYCSGECPYVFLQKYPHTHLVQQANPSGSAGPCCAPRKMSPISMLYFDQETNIIYGLLPGMVVDRCGCS